MAAAEQFVQPASDLFQRLLPAQDILFELDKLTVPEIQGLLPNPVVEEVSRLTLLVNESDGPFTILLDSDGTGYFTADNGNENETTRFRQDLVDAGRAFPGGAFDGEPPDAFVYSLKVAPAMVEVWRRLESYGVGVSIFSGRKAADINSTYELAFSELERFCGYPSKGRGKISGPNVSLNGDLATTCAGDPLGQVAVAMRGKVLSIVDPAVSSAVGDQPAFGSGPNGLDYGLAFEAATGFKLSPQEISGAVVLLRLRYRHRAFTLAQVAGCPLTEGSSAREISGSALSEWLNSGDPTASGVLEQLRREVATINEAWIETLGEEPYAALQVTTKDEVGWRSLSQDYGVDIDLATVLSGIESDSGQVILMAGDNYGLSGNDRPVMDLLRESPSTAFAVQHIDKEGAECEPWMVSGNQFHLFIAQLLLARQLAEQQM